MAKHDLFTMVPDYINGHLNLEQAAEMEEALKHNAALRQQVQFERLLQKSLRSEPAPSAGKEPHFAAVRQHINDSSKTTPTWTGWGLPVAACLLVLVFAAGQLMPTDQTMQTFETLSDTPVEVEADLRIILNPGSSNATLDAMVIEYQLHVVKRYPEIGAIDVALSAQQQQSNLAAKISSDERVLQVHPQTPLD